jgi:hypothetical protein
MAKLFACFMMVCWLAWSACSDEHACTDADCLGLAPGIPLVDESGMPVIARGEVQNLSGGGQSPFDCTVPVPIVVPGPRPIPASGCVGNVVVAGGEARSSKAASQIRFEQSDGSFTPWQPVAVDVTRHTDPDFNGPGCPCTWYSASAGDVIVPVSARRVAGVGPDAG